MQAFFLVVIFFLSAVGLTELIIGIVSLCERSKCELTVIPVYGHCEDIEMRLRGVCMRLRCGSGTRVVVVDCGADEETTELCRRLCYELRFDLMTKKEFDEQILTNQLH